MIEVEEFAGGLRVVDAAKNEVTIEIDDWERGGEVLDFDRHVDEKIAGRASEIRIPGQTVVIESSTLSRLFHLDNDDEYFSKGGLQNIQVDDCIATYVVVNGDVQVNNSSSTGNVQISFNKTQLVTLGFRSHVKIPPETLSVPPSADGLAYAVSRFGDYHLTESPDRSYPSMRGHPPLIQFLDDTEIDAHPSPPGKTLFEFQVPPSLDIIFFLTSLSYYLGTSIRVCSDEETVLVAGETKFSFNRGSAFPHDVARVLKKVFYLDCLVRSAGPNGIDIRENEILEYLPFDSDTVFELPMVERVQLYLETPFEAFGGSLPEWPLSMSIGTTLENSETLPYVAKNLALLFKPASSPATLKDTLKKSFDDSYRTIDGHEGMSLSGNVPIVEPTNQIGASHGWLADGAAVDAFNCRPQALANKYEFLDSPKQLSIHVVLNEESMVSESIEVSNQYNQLNVEYEPRFEIHKCLKTEELAVLLEEHSDFIHYIGHCEPDGFQCVNGHLSTSTLSSCGAQTFFLNGCTTYQLGMDLVDCGSVAGGVTVGDVLENQARKVGTSFARLICNGQNIHRALRLARSKTIMNRCYTVVGDGTHVITQGKNNFSEVIFLTQISSCNFSVRSNSLLPQFHGSINQVYTASKPVLLGNDDTHIISEDQLRHFLSIAEAPFIFKNNLYWPEELERMFQ